MKRYAIPLVIVLAGLMAAQITLGQVDRAGRSDRPAAPGRPRYQGMSQAEREKFRAEMEERRKKFENMSEEEKEKFRAEMRQRFPGSRPQILGRQQQLEAIAAIQGQLDRLKAAVESIDPNVRSQFRDLPEADRAKLRENIGAAMRDRQTSIRAIERELAKLKFPGHSAAQSRPDINELRAIHGLAVKEKATETAKRIEKLIARYSGQAPGRDRPSELRPRRGRPPRPDRP